MNPTKTRLSRRNFLFAIGAGSAATAAAIASRSVTTSPAPTTGAESERTRGYRESDHVRRYYQTAKN